jgi:hypothetical protein
VPQPVQQSKRLLEAGAASVIGAVHDVRGPLMVIRQNHALQRNVIA